MAKKKSTKAILRRTHQMGREYEYLRAKCDSLKSELAATQATMRPWTDAIDILREELSREVLPKGGSVEVWGPQGLGCNVTICVKPRKHARALMLTVRPHGIGTSEFCFRIVSDEVTGDYKPGTLGQMNGLNFCATPATVVTAHQLLTVMALRHKAAKHKTKIGGKP